MSNAAVQLGALSWVLNPLWVLAVSFPWYTWKVILDDQPHFGCSHTHFVSWFSETCHTDFFCDASCSVQQAQPAAVVSLNTITFLLLMGGMSINMICSFLFCCCWKPSEPPKRISRVAVYVLQLALLTVAMVVYPSALPAAYGDSDLCMIPNFGSISGADVTPCSTFIGSVPVGVGTNGNIVQLSWGGAGLWICLPLWLGLAGVVAMAFKKDLSGSCCYYGSPPTFSGTTTTVVVPSYTTHNVAQHPSAQHQPAPYMNPQPSYPPAPISQPYSAQPSYTAPPHNPQYDQGYTSPVPPENVDYVSKFLAEQDLGKYIEAFKLNEFDWNTFMKFPQLKEEEQSRVVPAIGARLKLIEAIENHLRASMPQKDYAAPPYQPPPY